MFRREREGRQRERDTLTKERNFPKERSRLICTTLAVQSIASRSKTFYIFLLFFNTFPLKSHPISFVCCIFSTVELLPRDGAVDNQMTRSQIKMADTQSHRADVVLTFWCRCNEIG